MKKILIIIIVALTATWAYPQCMGIAAGAGGGATAGSATMDVWGASDSWSQAMSREASFIERAYDLPRTRLVWAMMMNATSHPVEGIKMGDPLGKKFIQMSQERGNSEIYGIGFGFVLAHEYAHQFQFKHLRFAVQDYQRDSRKIELQADLLGAYWMGVRTKQFIDERRLDEGTARRVAADAITEASFSVGEGWLAAHSHGTKAQRVAIASKGFQAGFRARFGEDLSKFKPEGEGFKWMNELVADTIADEDGE